MAVAGALLGGARGNGRVGVLTGDAGREESDELEVGDSGAVTTCGLVVVVGALEATEGFGGVDVSSSLLDSLSTM
jgi:hypothetical protein